MRKLVAVVAALVVSAPAWAAVKTVTLSVPGMECKSVCEITIKKALTKVDGVEKAEVSFEKKEAVVTFDDTKAKVEALLEATKNVGYPSTVKK